MERVPYGQERDVECCVFEACFVPFGVGDTARHGRRRVGDGLSDQDPFRVVQLVVVVVVVVLQLTLLP